MMKGLSLRVSKEIMDEVKKITRYEHTEQSIVLREALQAGLDELRKKTAINLFSKGKVTISEAADIADVSVAEMMDILSSRGIKSGISLEDLKGSLKSALKVMQ